jgi:hypothetical protein
MILNTEKAQSKCCRLGQLLFVGGYLLIAGACTPTVQLAAPTEPITINLNVKIEHEIRIKVEKELEELFSEDSDLF